MGLIKQRHIRTVEIQQSEAVSSNVFAYLYLLIYLFSSSYSFLSLFIFLSLLFIYLFIFLFLLLSQFLHFYLSLPPFVPLCFLRIL